MHISMAILSFLTSSFAHDLYSETVGTVIITQSKCVAMPRHISKRIDQDRRLNLIRDANTENQKIIYVSDLQPTTIIFLSEWLHTVHGIEKNNDIYEFAINPTDASICFPSQQQSFDLKRVVHGGNFSSDFQNYEFYQLPEYWAASENEQRDRWRNIETEKCSTDRSGKAYKFTCPETALNTDRNLDDFEKFALKVTMDSSNKMFTFYRKLKPTSFVIATRVKRAGVIENGNIFTLKTIKLPDRIFHMTLPEKTTMSIGATIIE